jgi:pimeloyl-ACP methyl ester carboxylesterase
MYRSAALLAAAFLACSSTALAACPDPDAPIDEAAFVPINGIEQWVTIKGKRCGNPAVLFIHGGPGNPLSPYADKLFGAWEQDFTLVQWDQRGAGMTYGRKPPPEETPLTMEQMTADGLAVAEHVTRHLGRPKLLLWGSSWGSMLGMHMVHARPALFAAYVGSAQVVDYRQTEAAAYAGLLALARKAGDADSIGKLEALGAPPWTNPRNFGVMRRVVRKYEALATDAPPKAWWAPAPQYATPQAQAGYTAGEDYSFIHFVGWRGDGMFSRFDLYRMGTRFAVPMYFVHGEEDLLGPIGIARRYFDAISAPSKTFVAVPRTGHDPNEAMLAAQYRLLREAASR